MNRNAKFDCWVRVTAYQMGRLSACCGFREHLSQEAIARWRVVACSQLQPQGRPPSKSSLSRLLALRACLVQKQHLRSKVSHHRRGHNHSKKILNCSFWSGSAKPSTEDKARQCQHLRCKPNFPCVAQPWLQKTWPEKSKMAGRWV